jgi:23S rRNA (pseudouridine1915-N3)-methyltransferase
VHLALIAVGKLAPAFRDAADDYLRRLGRHAEVTEIEVREAGRAPTAGEGRRQEGARLRDRLPAGSVVVVLDREGQGWSSEELARRVAGWQAGGRAVCFVIGGSHGLDAALLAQADLRWSLGPLTLPHQLARVVVAEQLYRAWTILRREPYHK